MQMIRLYAVFIALMLSSGSGALAAARNDSTIEQTISTRFADYGRPGAWLIQREGAAAHTHYGATLADKPQRPASTFKVMLALIALETGALRNADEIVPWDGRTYADHPEWQADMALRQAMQTSSESYFRVLAERIGRERLAAWVARVGYGNGRIGPIAARAWHDGVLTVTANQQLAFIERVRRGALPFAPANLAAVKAAMLDGEVRGRRIYGKTGTHLARDGQPGVGWWIGWVEGGGAATSFVLEVELETLDRRDERIELGKRLLADIDALPVR